MTNYASYTDEALVVLLRDKDQYAFTELFKRYWKPMLAVAMQKLNRQEPAEDIVQDIFTSLWHRAAEQEIHDLGAWLATAVKYKVITVMRRELRMELHPEMPEIPVVDQQAEYRFLQQAMYENIKQLPPRCRLIFEYHQQHFSNEAIAEKLSISEKAVAQQLTKARFSLRVALRQFLSFFV